MSFVPISELGTKIAYLIFGLHSKLSSLTQYFHCTLKENLVSGAIYS